jgi:hypothetical protein
MSNDQFLNLTFILGGCLTLVLGVGTYVWLRRPFLEIAASLRPPRLASVVKKLFPITKVVVGLLGFVSVSYYGSCPGRSYEEIVADRRYVVTTNQAQIATALWYLAIAVLVWGLLLTVMLRVSGPSPASRGEKS